VTATITGFSRNGSRTWAPAIALAVAAGAAPLVRYPPLTVPAVLAVAAATVGLAQRPLRALQLVILAVFLPPGLLPPGVQFAISVYSLTIAAMATAAHLYRTRTPLRLPPSVLAVTAFFVWSAMTLMWIPETAIGVGMLRRLAWVILLVLVTVNVVTTRDIANRFMNTLAMVGWVVIGAALWSLIAKGYSAGSRLTVLGYNDNQIGNVLLLFSIGVLWRVSRPDQQHRGRHLVEAIAYLALSLIVIALTGSRGSVLGFALLGGMFLLLPSTRRLAAAMAVMTGIAIVVAPAVFTTVDQRFTTPSGELSRQTLWTAGTALATAHPLGVGLGYGPVVMRDYINPRVSTDYFANRTSYPAHDPLIEIADDTGLPGLALYTAAFVVAGRSLWRASRRRRTSDGNPRQLAALIGMVSVPFLFVAAKSGGSAYDPTAFLLLALWLLPHMIRQTELEE
jgi:O-antigen ligase